MRVELVARVGMGWEDTARLRVRDANAIIARHIELEQQRAKAYGLI